MLTETNWLIQLRDSILERGTLYPEGVDVGPLTETNWLIKLRDDILRRQTLHPHGPNVGVITTNNFLVMLKDDIFERENMEEEEQWPLIPNPITAIDPWMKEEKGRTSDGQKWVSLIDFNVWQPSDYPQGWRQG